MGEKCEEINQKKQTNSKAQQYGDYQGKVGLWEVEEGKGGINVKGRRIDLGCKHKIQYTDDVFYNVHWKPI